MKKLIASLILAVTLISCSREVPPPTTPAQPPTVDKKASAENFDHKLRIEFFTS